MFRRNCIGGECGNLICGNCVQKKAYACKRCSDNITDAAAKADEDAKAMADAKADADDAMADVDGKADADAKAMAADAAVEAMTDVAVKADADAKAMTDADVKADADDKVDAPKEECDEYRRLLVLSSPLNCAPYNGSNSIFTVQGPQVHMLPPREWSTENRTHLDNSSVVLHGRIYRDGTALS